MRVPAGVYVFGRSYGGRFVSQAQLVELLDLTDQRGRNAILELAALELDAAAEAEEQAERLFQDDPKVFAGVRSDAEAARAQWESLADQAAEDVADVDDMAPEWEVGFEYEGGGGGGFDLNFRIARDDGEDMGRREMLDVLRDFRRNLTQERANPVPVGYLIAAMSWRQTGRHTKGWVSSRDVEHDLTGSLAAPLLVHASDNAAWTTPAGLRAGSVRRL